MKTYRVTLTYDRRTHKCPVFEVDAEASVPMEAKALARQYALRVWSTACPLNVSVVELLTPERLARDEAELMEVMRIAA